MRTVGVSGLWKIFGRKPTEARQMAAEGATRQEIQSETGCLVGVREVSFEVNQGETFVVMGLSGSGKSTLGAAACPAWWSPPRAPWRSAARI